MMKKFVLVNEAGQEVKTGDAVVSFRDEKATVKSWTAPTHMGSTGRMYTTLGEHFPSVYGCKFVQVDDSCNALREQIKNGNMSDNKKSMLLNAVNKVDGDECAICGGHYVDLIGHMDLHHNADKEPPTEKRYFSIALAPVEAEFVGVVEVDDVPVGTDDDIVQELALDKYDNGDYTENFNFAPEQRRLEFIPLTPDAYRDIKRYSESR